MKPQSSSLSEHHNRSHHGASWSQLRQKWLTPVGGNAIKGTSQRRMGVQQRPTGRATAAGQSALSTHSCITTNNKSIITTLLTNPKASFHQRVPLSSMVKILNSMESEGIEMKQERRKKHRRDSEELSEIVELVWERVETTQRNYYGFVGGAGLTNSMAMKLSHHEEDSE
mmetsp:Transcript_9284/g.34344  ORF Transcript_9284/g.34344 Transcript_9284/m.34344 type:complete len:170 (-) Transcript_9284:203-712(-)|eukprot:CAMPEP_0117450250 /NCGR_PEP_ID=MMETSP0759-20121206/8368_1 /TAXON_ID=63605 /ORGANISM="Percolomonas cosmopolitus, Strain WS" /LENGTH=169 /DNA_ID=CAMNT_0005242759 /DNA_START=94 /DNA_END=603 /DNA_ORIENTATION=+